MTNDIIKQVLPEAYIEGITLETGGRPLVHSDPHIEHELEEKTLNREPRSMTVSVDIVMEEDIDDNVIGSWFGQQEVAKYLNLMVVQSRDKNITKALSVNPKAFQGLFRLADDRIEVQKLSAFWDVEGDSTDLTQHRSRTNDDGSVTHEFTFRAKYYIPTADPEHLAYFVLPYLDGGRIANDFNLKSSQMTRQMYGNAFSEIAIDNHQIVNTSKIVGKNGENIQLPNVKIHDFRILQDLSEISIDLLEFNIDGITKIGPPEFSRQRTEPLRFTRKSPYFTKMMIARDMDGNARFAFGIDIRKLLKENSRFGKLYDRMSIAGELYRRSRIDSIKVIRRRIDEKSKVFNRFETQKFMKRQFDNDIPVNIAISGDIDGGINEVSGETGGMRELDVAFERVIASETFGMRFVTGVDRSIPVVTSGVYQYGVDLSVVEASEEYLRELRQELIDSKNLLQTYLDEANKIGMVKWLREISDPHIDHEDERAAILVSSGANFDENSGRFTKNFRDVMLARWEDDLDSAPWVRPIAVYEKALDILQNVLDEDIILAYTGAIFSWVSPFSGTIRGIENFIDLFASLIQRYSAIVGREHMNTSGFAYPNNNPQYSPVSSASGGLTSPNVVTKEHWFDEQFDADIVKNDGCDYLSLDAIERSFDTNGLRSIDGARYEKRTENETLKYFDNTTPDVDLIVDNKVYTGGDTVKNTGFTFLSPGIIETPDFLMNTISDSAVAKSGQSDDDFALYKALVESRLGGTVSIGNQNSATKLPSKAKQYKERVTSLLARQDAVVVDYNASKGGSGLGDRTRDRVEDVFSLDLLEKAKNSDCDVDFGEDVNENPNTILSTMIGTRDMGKPRSIFEYDLTKGGNTINRINSDQEAVAALYKENTGIENASVTLSEAIKTLPNQFKALFLASTGTETTKHKLFSGETDTLKDVSGIAKLEFIFGMLQRVDVLVGFEVAREDRSAKSPIWEPLTITLYNRMRGRSLICKLKPYVGRNLGFWFSGLKRLNLPIYDEYFILTPTVTVDGVEDDGITLEREPQTQTTTQRFVRETQLLRDKEVKKSFTNTVKQFRKKE